MDGVDVLQRQQYRLGETPDVRHSGDLKGNPEAMAVRFVGRHERPSGDLQLIQDHGDRHCCDGDVPFRLVLASIRFANLPD
jgi:hypothetical protein